MRCLPRGAILAVHGRLFGLGGRAWPLGLWLQTLREAFGFWFGFKPSPPLTRPGDAAAWEALRQGPSLFLTFHFHRFEWLGAALAERGVPLLAAAKPFASAIFGRAVAARRLRYGIPVVERDVPRAALRHLRAGGCFALLWDQRPPPPSAPVAQAAHAHAGAERVPDRTPGPDSDREPGDGQASLAGIPVRMNPLPGALLRLAGPMPVFAGAWLPGGEIRLWLLCRGDESDAEARAARRYHRLWTALVRRYPTYAFGLLHRRFAPRDA